MGGRECFYEREAICSWGGVELGVGGLVRYGIMMASEAEEGVCVVSFTILWSWLVLYVWVGSPAGFDVCTQVPFYSPIHLLQSSYSEVTGRVTFVCYKRLNARSLDVIGFNKH